MIHNYFLSAIIVAYKSKRYIYDCVNSLKQSAIYAKIKLEIIIVINDKKNECHFTDCKVVLNNRNLGFARASNIGVKHAKGDILLFINPDTIVKKNTLKILLRYFRNNNICVTIPKILNANRTIQANILPEYNLFDILLEHSYLYKLFSPFLHHPLSDLSLYKHKKYINYASGVFFLIRKKCFDKVGGFDIRFFLYFEDIDLCKRISRINKILYIPESKIVHFKHQSNNGFMLGDIYLKSLYLYLSKYHSYIYTFICLIIVLTGTIVRLLYWHTKNILTFKKSENSIIPKIHYLEEILVTFFRLNQISVR